jgi:3-keto-5-aminohexanoate cleavage enzyme
VAQEDKVVVTAALSGVLANRAQCPHIPYTPAEIGEEAKRAYDAGAAVVHIHARTDDGAPTFEPEVFARIKEEIKKRCPVILNWSTGSLDDDTSKQEAYITREECRPDIAALNMGTMNYSKYSPKRKEFVFDMVFPNTYTKITRLLRAMVEAGVKPELECFDSGHTNGIGPLLDMGLLREPLQFSFIVNVLGGIPATVEAVQFQRSLIPAGSQWEVIGISHCQWRMEAASLVLGGNVRVGLEDHFYLPDGSMAKSNGELVAKVVEMARLVGRQPATPAEARTILGLDKFAPAAVAR